MNLSDKELRVLQSVFFLELPIRNEIARSTGLSTVLVSSLLNRLEEEGAIVRGGKTRARSGRPSTIYRLHPELGCTVGVSIETGGFRIVAVDAGQERFLEREYRLGLSADPERHIDELIGQVSLELERLMTDGRLGGRPVLAIGVTPPGMVDTERGIWLQGLYLSGITHVNLREILEGRFRLPVVVEDNARAVAFYEMIKGGGQDTRNFVLLFLGLGVGSGIVIDGSLYRGHNGLAGEVGHLIVDSEGDRCICGNKGCLETVVSPASILRRFQRRLEEGVISSLQRCPEGREGGLSLERICEAAAAADRLALSTLFEIGTFLGDACSKLIKLYNPHRLIISGAAAVLGAYLRDPIDLAIGQRVIPEMLADLEIRFAAYEPRHEAEGAALVAMGHFWHQPRSEI